jgi:carbon-monoxide dehydrogenase large subunit
MNFHPPFDEATTSICGLNVDSGNYEPALDRALELADYEQFRKEQRSRRDNKDTRQIGIGLSTYIEMCGLAPSNILGALRYAAGGWDAATIRCLPTGKVVVATGTSPHGQGHETTWSQIVADGLGVTPDDITVLHGDTQVTPLGMDTYGSRSLSVGGVALHFAMEKIVAKARTIAAHELEGRRGGPRLRGRLLHGEGRARQGANDPGAGDLGVARARSAERRRAQPRGHGCVRPAELHVAGRRPHLRERGRCGDRRRRHHQVRGRRRTAARSSTRKSWRARSTAV